MPFISYFLLAIAVVALGGFAYLLLRNVGKRLSRLLIATAIVLASRKEGKK